MIAPDVAAFVAQVRARRAAAGQPDHIEDEAVYRILDGILAGRGTVPTEAGTAHQALSRSTTTTAETGGRDE